MPIIKLETLILNTSKSIVFDVSRSVDLHLLSTQNTNERVVKGRKLGLLELNEEITWRAKHLGIYQNLTAKITAFNYPNHFKDEMVKGAFKSFGHDHYFTQVGSDVLMKDVFDYTSPFGVIGKLVDKLFLENYMVSFLMERNTVVKEAIEKESSILDF